jgi:hypothetical protein
VIFVYGYNCNLAFILATDWRRHDNQQYIYETVIMIKDKLMYWTKLSVDNHPIVGYNLGPVRAIYVCLMTEANIYYAFREILHPESKFIYRPILGTSSHYILKMGGPNLEVFKVCLALLLSRNPGMLIPSTVRHVHHVSHCYYVLLRHKSRQSILCTRFLA